MKKYNNWDELELEISLRQENGEEFPEELVRFVEDHYCAEMDAEEEIQDEFEEDELLENWEEEEE